MWGSSLQACQVIRSQVLPQPCSLQVIRSQVLPQPCSLQGASTAVLPSANQVAGASTAVFTLSNQVAGAATAVFTPGDQVAGASTAVFTPCDQVAGAATAVGTSGDRVAGTAAVLGSGVHVTGAAAVRALSIQAASTVTPSVRVTLVAPGTQTTGAVFAPSASATRALSAPGSPPVDAVIAPDAMSSAGAMVDPLSASSACERPAPSPGNDQEDDRLSQLFPDDDHSVSDDDVVLEDASADPPGLEPLSEQEEGQAKAQTAAWWKDKPLDKVPMVEAPFFVPLTDKNSQTVLQGLMRIHTEVKALGLPLVRLHSDRGREFINRKVTAWTLYHGIVQTSTSGDDWKANGRTENWVRLLKRSTRTLLAAHGALPSQWAFAMRHCAARLQAAALSMLGVPQPRLLPWNASLALRRRSWETKQPWAERVTRAHVLCPSPVLRGGHLVRTLDGSFVHTEALVEVADVVELRAYEPPKPSTRLRGKQPVAVAVVSSSVSPSFFDAPRTCFAVPQRGGERESRFIFRGRQSLGERQSTYYQPLRQVMPVLILPPSTALALLRMEFWLEADANLRRSGLMCPLCKSQK